MNYKEYFIMILSTKATMDAMQAMACKEIWVRFPLAI